ncbi:MAG TPA: transposase [Gaiellaceae bacterium]|nr:transposase [Gaiellaceae bacterium]
MGRKRREFAPGGVYHVFSRGSNRQAIFIYDTDRLDFLECLDAAVHNHGLRCLGYCLMPNHYHLVLETADGRVSEPLRALNGRYALRFNRRYDRDAHLFKNRFGCVEQTYDAQLFATLRYVVRNPVESGLCRTPQEWPWSSFRATVGLAPAPPFLDVGLLLSYFGDDAGEAMSRYADLVDAFAGV